MANKLTAVELDQCSQALATSACVNLRKSTRAITRWFDNELKPCGLRSTQLAIMLVIAVSERPTQFRIARELVTEQSTVSRNVKLLEDEGLVKLAAARINRLKIISLTPKGIGRIREAIPLWARTQKSFVSQFGVERWSEFLKGLAKTVSSVHAITFDRHKNKIEDIGGNAANVQPRADRREKKGRASEKQQNRLRSNSVASE